MADSNNYHEFCRLLARLKSNYQLGELVMVDSYQETIGLIAKFTVESLQVKLSYIIISNNFIILSKNYDFKVMQNTIHFKYNTNVVSTFFINLFSF